MRKRGPRAPTKRGGKSTREKGKLLPVVYPERLAEAIEREIAERFGGNRHEAAAQSGLSVIWLGRFLDPLTRPRSVQPAVFEALGRFFVGRRRLVAIDCFFPDGTSELLNRYGEWLRESLVRSANGGGVWVEMHGAEPSVVKAERDADGLTQRDHEREALWAEVQRAHSAIAERLENLFVNRTPIPARLELAKRRVLDPLIESAESGFIEPSWRHMRRADVHAVLMLGLEREEVLVGKDVPAERVAKVLAGRPGFRRQRRRGSARGPKQPSVDWAGKVRASPLSESA
jgi:hypothetical protein